MAPRGFPASRDASDFIFDPPAVAPLPPADESVPVLRIAPGVSYEDIGREAQGRAWGFARQRRRRNRGIDAVERARISRFASDKAPLSAERIAAGEKHNSFVAGVARCACAACVVKRARQRVAYARRRMRLVESVKEAAE